MINDTSIRASALREALLRLDASRTSYASEFVDLLLEASLDVRTSDVHLQPTPDGLDVRWRLDGVLQPVGRFSPGTSADVVSRLKVLAELLTYRTDVPQEGRLLGETGAAEVRVSSFPTLHGERAVLRFFATQQRYHYLDDLGLDPDVGSTLSRDVNETSGAMIISGPAGSGKTTTAYALMREIVRRSEQGRCVMSIEDPIEVALTGVAQAQANESGEFTLQAGLRSLLRQDPEVILVGEIRDSSTAAQVLQASLTGHLVLTTFHAGSSAEAIRRLSDMQVEAYQIRSGLLNIVNQRLVRRLCACSRPVANDEPKLGLPVTSAREAVGCPECLQTGYRERLLLAESLDVTCTEIGQAILAGEPAARLEQLAVEHGMVPLRHRACQAIEQGHTSPAEVRRVFGFRQR